MITIKKVMEALEVIATCPVDGTNEPEELAHALGMCKGIAGGVLAWLPSQFATQEQLMGAIEAYQGDANISFDDEALVSVGEAGGMHVAAWVWLAPSEGGEA